MLLASPILGAIMRRTLGVCEGKVTCEEERGQIVHRRGQVIWRQAAMKIGLGPGRRGVWVTSPLKHTFLIYFYCLIFNKHFENYSQCKVNERLRHYLVPV